MKLKADTILILAAVGIGGYLLYQLFQKGKEGADKVSQSIADLWMQLTSDPPVTLAGNAVLPSGQLVPLSQMSIRWDEVGNRALAKYGNTVLQLSPHDANGNYPATVPSS